MADAGGEDKHTDNGAIWLFPRCKTLRESAGMRIQQLAKEAGVDRNTVSNIEKNKPISKPIMYRVFNVLNVRHGGKLNDAIELKDSPRKR